MARQRELQPEVPLEMPGAPIAESKPPKFEAPTPADASGPVPRIIRPIERAGASGCRRYKVRCDNYGQQPVSYILARSEADARAHYLEASPLGELLKRLRDEGAEKVDPARLIVTVLPD